jgi:hypothetical protein
MNYKLFVDLDGVLADFEHGVLLATGKEPSRQSSRAMWSTLAKTPRFYAELEWMPGARALWDFVAPYEPTILTGLPYGKWAEPQKREWCRRELGPDVPVITCFSREKAKRAAAATPGDKVPVLIDDRESQKDPWEGIGGVFIHHTSVEKTIGELEDLGFGGPDAS